MSWTTFSLFVDETPCPKSLCPCGTFFIDPGDHCGRVFSWQYAFDDHPIKRGIMKPTVLLERFPYRYVQCGILEINGKPDYRIQKVDSYTGKYKDMYLCDNAMQLDTAMSDFEYTKWLDPDTVPCYIKDNVKAST